MIPYSDLKADENIGDKYLIKYTPRLLLQILGTNAGRNIVHPNIWVNASFADYKPEMSSGWVPTYDNPDNANLEESAEIIYPKWIFTDMRFPNEVKAIEEMGGLSIRVVRNYITGCDTANDVALELIKLYVFSDVVSGEFINNVTFDSTIPTKMIQKGIDDFLKWDESP